MLRAWISLALLAIAVGALGAWVLYYRTPAPAPASYALSNLKPGDVQRMRVERAGAAAIELEREGEGWRMTAPFSARVEPSQAERLLSILDARSLARYPAADLARYGLDPPALKVKLAAQTFAYGSVNEATREQYVLVDDAVYAIALSQRTSVARDPDAYISRALFGPSETPVRFDFGPFTAALENGVWAFVPSAQDADADSRNAWADAWRHATAARAAHDEGAVATSEITVQLKDGRSLALAIVQREPALVLVRRDENVRYEFPQATAKRLLAPPGATPEAVGK